MARWNSEQEARQEILDAGALHITMLTAKGLNPVACASCFSYVATTPGENKAAVICIDDRNNCATNSANICWFYDCDYSILPNPSITQIVFGGPRCKDHYLRALMAGIPKEKMVITHDVAHAAELVDTEKSKDILRGLYKSASFVIQAIVFKQTGNYIKQQKELQRLVSSNEKAVVDTFVYLKNGGKVDFIKMSKVLFAWCKKQIANNK